MLKYLQPDALPFLIYSNKYRNKYITMNGPCNVKFSNAQQAKQTYKYKNIKEKMYTCNAAIWSNKICRQKQLTLF